MSSPKTVQPTQVDPLRPEYRGLSSDLASYGRTLVGKAATPYSGSFTAPLGSGESDILRQINDNITSGGSFAPERDNLISQILSGSRLSPNTNPYLDATINELSRKSNEGLGGNLNLIDAAFGRSGMRGASSGRGVEAIQASRLAGQDLTSQIAQILGGNYQQGLNEQMNVLGSVLPQLDQAKSTNLYNALGANALPRSINQADLTARYQDFLRQIQEASGNTSLASSILGSQPGLQYSNPSYNQMPFWQQLLLGGVGGAAAGGAMALGKP